MGEGPAEHPSPGGRASGCHAPRAVARGAGLLAAGAGCVGCARALSTIGRASGACHVSCSRITVPAWCWPSRWYRVVRSCNGGAAHGRPAFRLSRLFRRRAASSVSGAARAENRRVRFWAR